MSFLAIWGKHVKPSNIKCGVNVWRIWFGSERLWVRVPPLRWWWYHPISPYYGIYHPILAYITLYHPIRHMRAVFINTFSKPSPSNNNMRAVFRHTFSRPSPQYIIISGARITPLLDMAST